MTRGDLERERDMLQGIHDALGPKNSPMRCAALASSIARINALLSLADEDCRYMSDELLPTAPAAWHVVAAIVRRTA